MVTIALELKAFPLKAHFEYILEEKKHFLTFSIVLKYKKYKIASQYPYHGCISESLHSAREKAYCYYYCY